LFQDSAHKIKYDDRSLSSIYRQCQHLGLKDIYIYIFLWGFSLSYTCNTSSKRGASSSNSSASSNPCTIYWSNIYSLDCEGIDWGNASYTSTSTRNSISSIGTASCPGTDGQCGYTGSGSEKHVGLGCELFLGESDAEIACRWLCTVKETME
jgi:hypothetical protein